MLNRRQQILTIATGLFSQQGYDGTSIRDISGACGITEAAIYRHFKGKTHLYEEVIRHKVDQHDIHTLEATRTGAGSIEILLRRVSDHILAVAERDPDMIRLMFSNSLEKGELAAILFREVRLPYIRFLTRELEHRIAAGEIRAVAPYITSRCFVGMVMDCALNIRIWSIIENSDFAARDVVNNNVPIFARGLLLEASPPVGADNKEMIR